MPISWTGFSSPQSPSGQKPSDIKRHTALPIDAHLMTVEPGRHLDAFRESGIDSFTFHIEACVHAHRLITEIKAKGLKAGISLVPSTPVSALDAVLPFTDQVLVMTVNPGWGGQGLIPECVEKIKILAAKRKERKLDFLIAVDGGVNENTAAGIIEAGADILVAGTSVLGSDDMGAAVQALRKGAS